MLRKVCVFTGSRAEYGLLAPLMREVQSDRRLQLRLIVSGSHLEPAFGETWREIVADGFAIDAKVDMKIGGDQPVEIAQSMARCLAGCAEALARISPDVLVLLGDRYEALAAAEAAMLLRIPIAHIHGGETTEGAIDDVIRHAITKLSHLHFVAAEEYRQCVVQLGEDPHRVFTVGAPGLDVIGEIALLGRAELEQDIGFHFANQNILVTYHPATLSDPDPSMGIKALFDALDEFSEFGVIITKSNADAGGRRINELIDEYASRNAGRVLAVASLGQRRYLSVMSEVDAVVGNSSSGIIEAPSMGKPTLNIGARQRGRARAPSVVDCTADTADIVAGLTKAVSSEMAVVAARKISPYSKGNASLTIKNMLAEVSLDGLLLKSVENDCRVA